MPPNFGERSYWDSRFEGDSSTFDWLLPASVVGSMIGDILATSQKAPHILHIGSGSSSLSSSLRRLVENPAQICNVDYSRAAVQLGRRQEIEEFGEDAGMRWAVADLLSYADVSQLRVMGMFDVVVDKSTADAIACGDDREVSSATLEALDMTEMDGILPGPVHPELLLLLHVATLTKSGALWLCFSYSASRFENLYDRSNPMVHLWHIDSKEPIEVSETTGNVADVVHRPKIVHWLYVLRRL